MQIQKVYNNNLASIMDENNHEVIIMGRGIAFGKKAGDEVDESMIDKRLYMENQNMNDKLKQLLNDIPIEHIELASKIIEYAKNALDKQLSDSLYISLSDYIYLPLRGLTKGFHLKIQCFGKLSDTMNQSLK